MGGHFLGMKEERNTRRKEAGSLWAQDGGWKKPLSPDALLCPSMMVSEYASRIQTGSQVFPPRKWGDRGREWSPEHLKEGPDWRQFLTELLSRAL